jgi:hypothetical protein
MYGQTNYPVGTLVGIMTRKGFIDCVIVDTRTITRGKNMGTVEHTLAPLQDSGKSYQFRARGESHFKAPRGKYTDAQIATAANAAEATGEKLAKDKQERADRGRDALGKVDYNRSTRDKQSGTEIGIGDRIRIEWRGGQKTWETVVFVNFQTGKVAYHRALPRYERREDFWAELERALGTRSQKRGRKPWRYIHPDQIIEVEKATDRK